MRAFQVGCLIFFLICGGLAVYAIYDSYRLQHRIDCYSNNMALAWIEQGRKAHGDVYADTIREVSIKGGLLKPEIKCGK